MKKIALFLALMLTLSGCQSATQTNASSQDASSNSLAEISRPETSSLPEDAAQSSSATSAPMPEGLPASTPEALALPDTVFTSTKGYRVEVLTPAQYEIEMPLNRGGYRGYMTSDYFQLQMKPLEKFAVANENGKIVTDFVYTDIGDGWFANDGITSVMRTGSGLLDVATGKELTTFEENAKKFPYGSGSLYKVMKDDITDIVDRKTGETVLSIERGETLRFAGDNYLVLQSGMLRFYDSTFSPLKNFACNEVGSIGEEAIAVNCGGKWGLCDLNGNFIVEPIYESMDYQGGDYASITKGGMMGVIDVTGKVVVKPEWSDLILYENSASVEKAGRWGAVTDLDNGKISIEPMYDFIYGFSDDGFATYERNSKYGILDREGNEVVTSRFETIIYDSDQLADGYYFLEGDGPLTAGIINGKGDVIVPNTHQIFPGINYGNDDPFFLVCTPTGKWGYMDHEGQFVINAVYDNADAFLPGRDVAFVEKEGKICLIDRKGNVVLETVFSDLTSFNAETMVCAMEYTDAQGLSKECLVKIHFPA